MRNNKLEIIDKKDNDLVAPKPQNPMSLIAHVHEININKKIKRWRRLLSIS